MFSAVNISSSALIKIAAALLNISSGSIKMVTDQISMADKVRPRLTGEIYQSVNSVHNPHLSLS